MGLVGIGSMHLLAQGPQLTLTPTLYNGYHITCFGKSDGAIDLSITGGTAPYSYLWSTGATTQDVTDLRAGYISVVVKDAANVEARADMTLTEPYDLLADEVPYLYGSGFNISCVSCYNGSIQVTTSGGVAPYTYEWVDGPITEDRTQLDAGSYQVYITDANGCFLKGENLQLTQPERDDWSKSGNAGSDPNTQFIGTTDNKDVVLKSNATEALRLKSNGDIKVSGALTNFGLLYRDENGILRAGGVPAFPPLTGSPCRQLGWFATHLPYWEVTGNTFTHICGGERPLLGTLGDTPLSIITNNEVRMFVTPEGKVGIGTEPEEGVVEQYRLYVEDGIVTRDVLVTANAFPDYVFAPGYELVPLEELKSYIHINGHLPNFPTAAEVTTKRGMEVGDLQLRLVKTVEEQQLYILQLHEELVALKARLEMLEADK